MMELAEHSVDVCGPELRLTIAKAFVAAFLLTAREQSAEAAVMAAIAAWNPASETGDALLRLTLLSALNHTWS